MSLLRAPLVLAALASLVLSLGCSSETSSSSGFGRQGSGGADGNGASSGGGASVGTSSGSGNASGSGGGASASGSGSSSGGSIATPLSDDAAAPPPSDPPAPGGFQLTIAPLLDANGCTECHHHGRPIDVTTYPFMTGTPATTAQALVQAFTTNMPPAPRPAVPQSVIDQVNAWVDAGMLP